VADKEGGRDYGNKAARKVVRLLDFLLTGAILEWKSLEEAATGAGLTRNEAYGILRALVEEDWVEKSDKGFRSCYGGLAQYLLAAQEELMTAAGRLGLRRAGV